VKFNICIGVGIALYVAFLAWVVYSSNGESSRKIVLQHRDVIVLVEENGELVAKWLEPESVR
jgi:hypothetical protein